MEKSVQFGAMRYGLQHSLLELANYDYQLEMWCDPERKKIVPLYVGVWATLESLIEDYEWEDNQMIGSVLRNKKELDACRAVFDLVFALDSRIASRGVDEDYINDPAWPPIIAAARHALRVMLEGDS